MATGTTTRQPRQWWAPQRGETAAQWAERTAAEIERTAQRVRSLEGTGATAEVKAAQADDVWSVQCADEAVDQLAEQLGRAGADREAG